MFWDFGDFIYIKILFCLEGFSSGEDNFVWDIKNANFPNIKIHKTSSPFLKSHESLQPSKSITIPRKNVNQISLKKKVSKSIEILFQSTNKNKIEMKMIIIMSSKKNSSKWKIE